MTLRYRCETASQSTIDTHVSFGTHIRSAHAIVPHTSMMSKICLTCLVDGSELLAKVNIYGL